MHHLMLAYTKVVLRSSIFWKPKSLQHQVADFLYFEESYLQGKRIGCFLVVFFSRCKHENVVARKSTIIATFLAK